MDIRVLRYFLAVAQEENITRAAESLHIAQPSLSKQMMELERELGKPLLVRGKRKISLTEDGLLLRRRAEELVTLMDKTESELRADSSVMHGEISIGGNPTESILQTASALRTKYPDIRFHFFLSDAIDVLEHLNHGTLDFAALLTPVDTLKYDFVPLHDVSQWGLLMKSDDPLAKNPTISREQVRTVPLIMHRRPGLQREVARWAQTEPSQLNISATYNVMNGSRIRFVLNNLGYFLSTRDQLAPTLDGSVCFRPFDPPLEIHYALVWKRHTVLSKAAQAFVNHLPET